MMKMHTLKTLIAAAVSAAIVAGCSGGGSGSDSATSDSSTGTSTTGGVATGVFVDSPVEGLSYESSAGAGKTDAEGHYKYIDGEQVSFNVGSKVNLGSVAGKGTITPLDLVPSYADDRIAKAIASLLQSLDADGNPGNGINISGAMIGLLEQQLGDSDIDFTTWDDDGASVDTLMSDLSVLLNNVVTAAASDGDDSTNPVYVSPADAMTVLMDSLVQQNLFKKNISKTPEADTDKVGIDIFDDTVPARSSDGTLLTDMDPVHPIITSYADGVGAHGEWDPFSAISYDNGQTWKTINLFRRAGDEMSVNHTTFYAKSDTPSMHIEGKNVLVTWISTFCQGGPESVTQDPDTGESSFVANVPYPAADLLGDRTVDWFRVLGNQGTVTYTFDNNTTLTNPYFCTWAARGVLDVDGSYGSSIGLSEDTTGQVVWMAPEQLSSGTRDAKLNTPAGAEGAGFGVVWQEDPEGLLPGQGEGPGVGWSGATTHHKTDIWYSFLNEEDFSAVAPSDTDTVTNRPKPLVPFSVPVPISNNAACRLDASSGKVPAYCDTTLVPNTPFCVSTEQVETQNGSGGTETGTFCVTKEGQVLDGNTGASRPNLHFAEKLDASGNVIGARALLMYEESKGMCEEGKGCPDAPYDTGKFVMYHHIPDFKTLFTADDAGTGDVDEEKEYFVAQGDILDAPVEVATFDPLSGVGMTPDEYCAQSEFCEPGEPLYENARRERFVVNDDPNSDIKFVVIYKQGYFNQGERADIFMRRAIGGYDFEENIKPYPDMCVSCVTPDPETLTLAETDDYTYVTKVGDVLWSPDNVNDESWTNPYDDARSLRAQLQGDRLLIGYAWTPNWLLATNSDPQGYFKDNYDFYVRRSYQVGAADGKDVFFDAPVDTSHLVNNHESVVEPRIAPVADSIFHCSSNDPSSCITVAGDPKFVVTYCTAENVERYGEDGRPIHAPGLDCFYNWTADGVNYVDTETVTQDDGTEVTVPAFQCLACEKDLEEVEPEVVLTPDGSQMHAGWAANGELDESGGDMKNGSDAWYGLFSLQEETTDTTE